MTLTYNQQINTWARLIIQIWFNNWKLPSEFYYYWEENKLIYLISLALNEKKSYWNLQNL